MAITSNQNFQKPAKVKIVKTLPSTDNTELGEMYLLTTDGKIYIKTTYGWVYTVALSQKTG